MVPFGWKHDNLNNQYNRRVIHFKPMNCSIFWKWGVMLGQTDVWKHWSNFCSRNGTKFCKVAQSVPEYLTKRLKLFMCRINPFFFSAAKERFKCNSYISPNAWFSSLFIRVFVRKASTWVGPLFYIQVNFVFFFHFIFSNSRYNFTAWWNLIYLHDCSTSHSHHQFHC